MIGNGLLFDTESPVIAESLKDLKINISTSLSFIFIGIVCLGIYRQVFKGVY